MLGFPVAVALKCLLMASAPTRPQLKERFERRHAEVLDRCATVFAERGYDGAAIEDLSAATGLTAGGLYHYIGSKEQALFAIFSRLMDPLLARAREIEDEEVGASERLRRLLRLWVGHVAEHHDHMLVFNQERHMLERDRQRWREIRDSRREFEELLGRLLEATAESETGEAARGEGDERSVIEPDLDLLRFALLGMVNHTAQWLRPDGRLSPVEIADGYWRFVLSSLKQ